MCNLAELVLYLTKQNPILFQRVILTLLHSLRNLINLLIRIKRHIQKHRKHNSEKRFNLRNLPIVK